MRKREWSNANPLSLSLSPASIAEALRDAKHYGYNDQDKPVSFNWNLMKQKRDAYVKRLNGIYERNLGNDKVDHIQGWASFVDKNTIRVQPAEGEAIQIKAKNILIAPGKNIHPPT